MLEYSQSLSPIGSRFGMSRNLAGAAGEFLEPEAAPKSAIPLDHRILSSGMKLRAAQAIFIGAGAIDSCACDRLGECGPRKHVQAERSYLLRHEPVLAGMMKTDFVEPAGSAPQIRLYHPMAWSIRSGFSKIDVSD